MKNNFNIPIYITENKYEFLDINYIHVNLEETTWFSHIKMKVIKVNLINFERIKDYGTFGIFIRKINHNQDK